MADQVVITLQGNSKDLEASIKRLQAGLNRLGTQATATQGTIRRTSQRTSQAINQQNKSVTLLVAKFALLAFAVQTVANIVDSTFGAVLRTIDEFQVAAIGTASAVTSIAQVGEEGIGDAFNQNLNAALATFEELEIVAAQFFSTGQELQLAFNTLAQRGVVIRQDEFQILGKITDQIKLLTGGQNTQIQIQQELRAILDGNVRTTTAFGKALQARGVDIAQLSKEVRATGSLEPFTPFLKGLDAAGPAIRRTLSSVTATFSSLFAILQRNIFQDTFDGIVQTITDVNNLIIDQRDTIIQIGIFIKDQIGGAWESTLGVLDTISATILRLVRNDLVQFATGIVIITKLLKRGPLGILLAIATALTGASGDVSTFGNVINIFVNSFALGLEFILRGLDLLFTRLSQLGEQINAFFSGGFDLQNAIGGLQDAENKVNSLARSLDILQKRSTRLFEIDDRTQAETDKLKTTLEEIVEVTKKLSTATADVGTIETNISRTDEGREFIEGRASGIGAGLRQSLTEFIQAASDASDQVAGDFLTNTKDEVDILLDQLKELASGTAIPPRRTGTFTDTKTTNEINRSVIDKQLQAQAKADDLIAQQRIKDADRVLQVELANIKLLAEQQQLTGKEAFDQANALNEARRQAQIEELQVQKAIQASRTQQSLNVVQATDRLTGANLAGLTATEERLAVLKLQTDETNKQAALDEKIAVITNKGAVEALNIQTKITEELRKANQLLDERERQIQAFGGETNAERAAGIDARSAQRQQNFNRQITDPAQQDRFAIQERLMRTQQAIEVQLTAIVGAIDQAFDTLIDGLVEGSFEFRDAAKNISKDLIKAGLDGLINEVKSAVSEGLTKIFDGLSTAAAQRSAQALALGLGLLLAVLSRIGNTGDFQATGGGGGGGIDSSGVATRGLIGGDTSIATAEINEGLQEALIPTNAILAQIELNTRGLADLNLGIDPNALSQAITAQVQSLFSQALLQT